MRKPFNYFPKSASTRLDPTDAHVMYIRHLSQQSAVKQLLIDVHDYSESDADEYKERIARFIDQGLAFHNEGKELSQRVKPVFQYYSYLNLASAIILIYKPINWEEMRRHGVSDLTPKLDTDTIELSSPIIGVNEGAVPRFHSVYSDCTIPHELTFRNLISAIPMISAEFMKLFNLPLYSIQIEDAIGSGDVSGKVVFHSQFILTMHPTDSLQSVLHDIPLDVIFKAIPSFKNRCNIFLSEKGRCILRSNANWKNMEEAQTAHSELKFRCSSYGSIPSFPQPPAKDINFFWYWEPGVPMLPTLTSAILMSFFLSSLCRYRAGLLSITQNSQINLLLETFTGEADGFILPAMRQLLYREINLVSATEVT